MAILTKGQTFADSDSVTSTKLNNLVDAAAFVTGASGSTDDASLEVNGSGRLQVKDSGVISSKIDNGAVTTVKIADANVTTVKIADANVTTAKIADANVTTAKIADASITAPKLNGEQTGTAPIFGARAWVVFDLTRNEAGGSDTANTNRFIYASGNVSSVTKINTGEFDVNFTTNLPSVNYTYSGSGMDTDSVGDILINRANLSAKTVSKIRLKCVNGAATAMNFAEICVTFLG